MKRVILSLLAASVVASCASTSTVMQAAPDATIELDRSPDQVAYCIANRNSGKVIEGESGAKLVQLKNMYGALILSFDIRPRAGGGSTVLFRRGNKGFGFHYDECLRPNWTPKS